MPRIPVRLHRFRGDHGDHPGFFRHVDRRKIFCPGRRKSWKARDTRLMAMGEEGVPTIEEYLMDQYAGRRRFRL